MSKKKLLAGLKSAAETPAAPAASEPEVSVVKEPEPAIAVGRRDGDKFYTTPLVTVTIVVNDRNGWACYVDGVFTHKYGHGDMPVTLLAAALAGRPCGAIQYHDAGRWVPQEAFPTLLADVPRG